jgi:hypothetical protein
VTRSATLRDQLTAGLVAGVVAGVLFEAFFFVLSIANGSPAARFTDTFVFIATTALGPAAQTNAAAVPIGIALHFCVAIGWAFGYVYLIRTQPQLLAHPWISGAAFGLVVYVFMQIVLLYAAQYHRPAPQLLAAQLIAHIVFYGIPVALIASSFESLRMTREPQDDTGASG